MINVGGSSSGIFGGADPVVNDIATVYASRFKTGANDWGQAINAAINSITNGNVILPNGTLTYTSPIVTKSNIRIKGQGIGATILNPSGCHGISTALNNYLRFATVEDLTIRGDNAGDFSVYDSNKNGVNFNSGNKETYQCTLRNVRIENMAGKGIYAPFDFNNLLENISVTHCGGNGIELNGFISDTLINCHVDYVANGMCAYRIYARAHLMSCNGMGGNGEYWGIFGRRNNLFVDTTDNAVNQYWIVLENCNVEDFTKVGLKFIYEGGFELRNTDLMAPATGTFDCFVEFETLDKTSLIDGLTRMESKGGTRNWVQPMKSNSSTATLITYNPLIDGFSVDGTTKVKIPVVTTEYEFNNNIYSVSYMNIKGMSYYYLGGKKRTYGTAAPTTGTWAVGDVVENTNTTIGTYAGWVCITAGTPGTWRPFGQAGVRTIPTASRPAQAAENSGYMYFDSTLGGKPVYWNGVNWVDATSVIPENIGVNKVVSSGATTMAVAFASAEADANYAITVSPRWNTTYWITSKTASGYTINFGTAPASDSALDWSIRR